MRRVWCTPLLTKLRDAVGRRYFYLGFPGPKAKDLDDWEKLDLIGRVCAFELLNPASPNPHDWLDELEEKLATLLAPKDIPYRTHLGLLEHVMIKNKDLMGQAFVQDSLVTLYQLDFCHALTDPSSQEVNLNLRYEAIRKLLEHQCRQPVSQRGSPFIMFLTVRNEIDTESAIRFCERVGQTAHTGMIESILHEHGIRKERPKQPQHPILKAFAFDMLSTFFRGVNIRSLFMPPVYYIGNNPEDNMVLFSILGTFDSLASNRPFVFQELPDFVRLQGVKLDSRNRLQPYKTCDVETERFWPDVALDRFTNQFLEDPVWTRIPGEADRLS